ncbi:HNH endonuclease signature motif containing protein [Elioraea sp.]|uniref:HNH endonuclease signature motif containing protein n=1 Tax=Elioraea sp. TaxID=2185103 RepID=UPI0025BDEC35|nr:HNH endonuclease signature motif containing protein [Elioraea sp.]
MCCEAGRVAPARDVDHIDGDARNNARSNLRPLCHSCHSARTARDQSFGRRIG